MASHETPRTQRAVEITIAGQKIPLKTSGTEPERAREVVEFVTRRLLEIEQRTTGVIAPHQIALLALLELAEDYLGAKEKTEEYKRGIASRSDALLKMIDGETLPG